MEEIKVFLPEDRAVISLKGSFALKDKMKAVQGARWNPAGKTWDYPSTPAAAEALLAALSDHFGTETRAALETLSQSIREARLVKSCGDGELKEIPNEARPSWVHQKRAYWFARNLPGVMLSMDMGTGKTKVAINLFVNRAESTLLVVCPLSVVDVWPSEFEKHCPAELMPEIVSFGPDNNFTMAKKEMAARRCIKMAMARKKGAVIIINYESAWREPFASFILSSGFDMIIADEIHKIKSPGGKASMFFARVGSKVKRRVGLTGTPMPHSPLDVYAQYRFLDAGIFGTSFSRFKNRYAEFGGYCDKQVKGFQNQDELHRKFYSIAFRVEKREVLDLPEVVHTERYGILSGEARETYNTMEHEFYADVENRIITASNALVKLLRLQQITSGFIDDIHQISDAKERLFQEALEELPADEPVVVFCRFVHDVDLCKRIGAAAGRACYELTGRSKELKQWQSAKGGDMIVVQISSGGVGVDFTRARYAIYYSLGYSLGDYEQSLARIDRPGQTRSVINIHLIIKNTVDVKVYRALHEKKQVVTAILSES